MDWGHYRDFYNDVLKAFFVRQGRRLKQAYGAVVRWAVPFYAEHKRWVWAAAAGIVLIVVTIYFKSEPNSLSIPLPPPPNSRVPVERSIWHSEEWRLYGERFLTLLLSCVIGFVVGAFFSPALKSVRKVLWLLAAIGAVLYGIFGPFPMADTADYVISVIAFFAALAFGLRLGAQVLAAAGPRRRPTSYGSAQWATYSYLADKSMFGRDGFLLGEFAAAGGKAPVQPLHYTGNRHLLTVAPTRSGKGVSSIIPNLLTYTGSVFVIDPKGENALVTAFRRGKGDFAANIQGLGQKVMLVDPWDIAASKLGMEPAGFNPLDWIVVDDPDAAENAFILADALVIAEQGKSEDRFWDEEAKALLTGVILYVATAPEEAENRNLGRVRDIITLDDHRLRDILRAMYKHPHPIVRSTAARTAIKEDKLFGAVMASTQAHTHFLDSPRIRESLSRTDFSFEDLKTDPTSIYLILPSDRLHTFGRWMRLLIQQAITVNARNIEVKPKKPILFLLDEMPTLGRLPALEQAYGLMAGFGMQLWGICQDLSQLARVYGENGWQTFISNSGVIQYFGSRDKMTAEYFSTLCGVTTIEVHNFSWAVGQVVGAASSFTSGMGGGSSSSSSSHSDSWTRTNGVSEAQRKLAYPDELMVMHEDVQVVFVDNLDPIPSRKITWYKDSQLKGLGVDLFKDTSALLKAFPKPKIIKVQTQPVAFIAEETEAKTETEIETESEEMPPWTDDDKFGE